LAWTDDAETKEAGQLQCIHRLIERRVDGIILTPVNDLASDEYFHEANEHGVPLIVMDRFLPKAHTDFVGTDDERGGYEIGRYLIGLGHRRLLHLAGTLSTSPGHLRAMGFERAVAECPGAELEVVDIGWGQQPARPVDELLDKPGRPTAVFAANDLSATFVYQAAERLGLNIPRDLSVVGFGKYLNRWLAPHLTTYDQFPEKLGREAAELVLSRIAGKGGIRKKYATIRVPGKLVRGASCAPPSRSV
jgi:LacI family transcriptional regulator